MRLDLQTLLPDTAEAAGQAQPARWWLYLLPAIVVIALAIWLYFITRWNKYLRIGIGLFAAGVAGGLPSVALKTQRIVAGETGIDIGPVAFFIDAGSDASIPLIVAGMFCVGLGFLQENGVPLEGKRLFTSETNATATGDGARTYIDSEVREGDQITITHHHYHLDEGVIEAYIAKATGEIIDAIRREPTAEKSPEELAALDALNETGETLKANREDINQRASSGDPEAIEAIREATERDDFTSMLFLLDADSTAPSTSDDNRLRRQIAALALARGDFNASIPELKRILASEPDDRRGWMELLRVYMIQGKWGEAERILNHLVQGKNPQLVGLAYHNLALAAAQQGNLDEAQSYLDKSVSVREFASDEFAKAGILIAQGVINIRQKKLSEAEGQFLEAISIYERLGDSEELAIPLANLGGVYVEQGNVPKAEEYLQKALELNKQANRPEGVAMVLGMLGEIERSVGNHFGAAMYFEAAIPIEHSLGRRYVEARRTLDLAMELVALYSERKSIDLLLAGVAAAINAYKLAQGTETQAITSEAKQFLEFLAESQFGVAHNAAARGAKAPAREFARSAWQLFDILNDRDGMNRCRAILESDSNPPTSGDQSTSP